MVGRPAGVVDCLVFDVQLIAGHSPERRAKFVEFGLRQLLVFLLPLPHPNRLSDSLFVRLLAFATENERSTE